MTVDWPMTEEKIATILNTPGPRSDPLRYSDVRSKGDLREWKTCDFTMSQEAYVPNIYELLHAYVRARMRSLATTHEIERRMNADHDVLVKNGKVTSWPTDKDQKW